MDILKHILSYVLLLVYGVSFGHQLIPHHHHEINTQLNHHHSGVHNHCIDDKETHQHVEHGDHFDEGVIDLLACILGEHEHNPEGDGETVQVPNDSKYAGEKHFVLPILPVQVIGPDVHCKEEYVRGYNCAYRFIILENLLALNQGKRGPPMS